MVFASCRDASHVPPRPPLQQDGSQSLHMSHLPVPPRPPLQQDGSQSLHMSHLPVQAPGFNQQMMPPPMGPGSQMGGYSLPGKMCPAAYNPHYQNGPYSQTGNYGMWQSGPGMGNYPQNVYNGPNQMGPDQPMYMGDPGMNRTSYNNNMYSGLGNMMGMNNQYVSYNGPGHSSQHGPGTSIGSPSVKGPQGNINPMGPNSSGSNGPVTGPTQAQTQGHTVTSAQAAALANVRSHSSHGRLNNNPALMNRMFESDILMGHVSSSIHPESLSHLSEMGQADFTSSDMNNMLPDTHNSMSPGPNSIAHKPYKSAGMMHSESGLSSIGRQPRKKKSSKSVKSSSVTPTNILVSLSDSRHRSPILSPHVGMSGQQSNEMNVPQQVANPASLSDTGSHSNDSSSMGPILNDSNSASPCGRVLENSAHRDMSENSRSTTNTDCGQQNENNNKQQLVATANNSNADISAAHIQSITSPVTSLSTHDGNSNDSQPIPMEPLPALKNCVPSKTKQDVVEPPEKKRKTKSSGGDYLKLIEMGNEPGRRAFLQRLFAFLEDKGTPISNMPVICKQPIDLYRLYVTVQEKGGMVKVTKAKKWKEICGLINVGGSASAAFTLKKNYIKFLFAHECYFDHDGMDPAPVLAQMEYDLEKKRTAKQRNSAPSPAGSQCSQDGIPNQYMQNDPDMGQGMMGNHILNNMGPHGGPVMGQIMGGPHRMGQGMQGQGHMMGSIGHQKYPGNIGYMMQGGPSSMMGGNMVPQSGMMGSVMQAPNTGMMGAMGPGPQQSNMLAYNSMNSQPGMMNNMNMMSHNNMMPSGNMGNQPGGMMHPSNMNPQHMMRATMSHPSNGSPVLPPNSMMRGNSDNLCCQDPFADEPYQKGNAGPGQMQSFSDIQSQSISPMPLSSGGMAPSNGTLSSQNGNMPPNTSSMSVQPNSSSMPTQISQSHQNVDIPINSSRMMHLNMSEMPMLGEAMLQNSGMPSHSSSTDSTCVSSASMPYPASSSSVGQPHLYSQDSNSNSSLPEMPQRIELQQYGPPNQMELQQYGSNEILTRAMSQSISQAMIPPSGQINASSQFSNAPGRQFSFGENQFSKTDRFDAQSPSMSQAINPQMSQAPLFNQQSMGPYPQQQAVIPQAPYMNPQQSYSPHYGNHQMPAVPADQYNQGYSGTASQQTGYASRSPMMGPQGDNYQGYSDQGLYGKAIVNGNMLSNMYTTPNIHFPDNRPESYTSPAYGNQSYGDFCTTNYCDPSNASPYQSSSQPYSDYTDSGLNAADRSNQNQWSPMLPQHSYHSMSQCGPVQAPGMSPGGPQSMSRMRMSPNKYRDYSMSENNKQRPHTGGMPGFYKKDMHFPLDTVESTQPLMNKQRKLTKHDVGQIEAWRLMMSLKSGLMAESTWALDVLNILLCDDSTVAYFGLAHLPGLLEVLLDHFLRCLVEMFDLFEDTQIFGGHEDFKTNLIRMAILESGKEHTESLSNDELKELNRVSKTIVKIENAEENSSCEIKTLVNSDKKCNDDDQKENNFRVQSFRNLKSRPNYTCITRQGKEVQVEENSDLNGLLDDKYWDVYGDFSDQFDLSEFRNGDFSAHIFTHMEDINKFRKSSQKFFQKPVKLKDISYKIKNDVRENKSDLKRNSDEKVKIEKESDEPESQNSLMLRSKDSDDSESKKCETSSDNTDSASDKSGNEKDHTCNKFLQRVALKSEQQDLKSYKPYSSDSLKTDENIENPLHGDEPRIKLPVKFELLDGDELVQICKTQFGLNSEGERNCVEDESYQQNSPPVCLTTDAQYEISQRCICLSNIFRSLSCIPGNDLDISSHSGLMYVLGKLLLLHHKHLPRSQGRRKFDLDDIEEDLVDATRGITKWWWDCLNVLRENTLVIFANICAQLRLEVFSDEICLPILDGLLHWVVCPSSFASDPLPSVGATSVLSPLCLMLEALCKLCIHDKNVDMLLASHPFERIVQLFSVLTKLLANKSEPVTMEFAIVLLSQLVQGGSSAARGIALQHPCISLLIDFIETAEQKAVQHANIPYVQLLPDSTEMMGTSLNMLQRSATVLLYLSKVPENHKLFVHHQSRLLSLVMSHILDHTVVSLLSDVLFQCSQES